MISLKSIIRLLLLGVAGLLTSCIDSREEYWLKADGSGKAEATYVLPAAIARMHGGDSQIRELITGFLKDTPAIQSSACEVITEGNRTRVKIIATFDSAMDLKNVATGSAIKTLPTAASHLIGEVKADLQGRTMDFTRKISAGEVLPGTGFLPNSQFEGHRLLYTVHLPTAVIESNATRVEDSGRTLVWDIPLAQAVKAPFTTRFKMEVPIPWNLVSGIAIPFSLVCGLAFVRLRKSRNRKEPTA